MSDGIAITTEDAIREIRFDRPPGNLLEPGLMGAIREAILAADDDADVLGIVLTGGGPDSKFCGGLDLARLAIEKDPPGYASALVELLRIFPRLRTPIAAAVNGDAVASGFSLAQSCDYVVSVPDAVLGTYEASVGTFPMVAMIAPLQRLLPRHALQNILTGEPFPAQRAYEIGAVNEIAPFEEIGAAARRFLEKAKAAKAVVDLGRPAFYRILDLPYDEALTAGLEEFVNMFQRQSARAAQS